MNVIQLKNISNPNSALLNVKIQDLVKVDKNIGIIRSIQNERSHRKKYYPRNQYYNHTNVVFAILHYFLIKYKSPSGAVSFEEEYNTFKNLNPNLLE